MPFDQGTITRADVEFRANTGQFKADVTEARRVYQQTTGAMSDDALRLAVAQEKLDRAIARHGPTSQSAKTATLGLRRELSSLEAEQRRAASASERTTRVLASEERALSRFGRGAVVGTGALSGLGRAATFASTTFLGGAGLVYGIRTALDAASDLHEQEQKNQEVFATSAKVVEDYANNALGLARDKALEVASSIGALLRPMGIVPDKAAEISVGLTKLGVDLASFYNTSVEDALAAIQSGLVGQVRPLRRYGVAIDAARVQEEALLETGKKHASALTNQEKVLARVALIYKDTKLAAGDYQRTIGGVANQERETEKNIRNTEESIGTTLEPAYLHLLQTVNAYLGSGKNQEEITRHVERALHDAGLAARGLERGFGYVRAAVSPLISALGGIDNAAELFLIAGAARKVKRLADDFGLIRLASRLTRRAVVADAAAEGAAMDALALGPIAGVAAALAAATAGVYELEKRTGLDKVLEEHVTNRVANVLFGKQDVNKLSFDELVKIKKLAGGDKQKEARLAASAAQTKATGEIRQVVYRNGRWETVAGIELPAGVEKMAERAWRTAHPDGRRPSEGSVVDLTKGATIKVPVEKKPTTSPATDTTTKAAPVKQTVADRVNLARLNLARGTPGAENDLLSALRAQVAYDQHYEKVQEGLIAKGIGNREDHAKILDRLRSDEESALNEIQSILDKRATAAKTAADKRAAAAKKQHQAEVRAAGSLPKSFEIEENQAKNLTELGGVYRKELTYQKQVVAKLRSQHAAGDVLQAALVEESRIEERIRKNRDAQAKKQKAAQDAAYKKLVDELGQPSLALRIRQAKLDALKAEGKDTRSDELKLLQAELAEAKKEYDAALKVASTRQKKDEVTLAYWEQRAQLEQQVADLKSQAKEAAGALTREFISEYQNITGTYAPNITGGTGAGAPAVTVHQHFPHPPTTDGHREATYAKHAFGAALD